MKFFFSIILFAFAAILGAAEVWNAAALMPGDVIQVNVFRAADFSKSVRIEEDGKFTYPLCGEVVAAGKTPRQISKELEKRLAKQITNPSVDVFVDTWAPRKVYILGEVNTSMALELPTYGRMTALQAISAAGGFTESADLNNVIVRRRDPKDASKLISIPIDVTALVSKNSGGDDFQLRPEDTLVVPKALPVYVSGEVNVPGVFQIDTQRPPLLSELVIRAGGFKEGANFNRIMIVRKNAKEAREPLIASLKVSDQGIYENDIRVQPGDYVMVDLAKAIYVLGQVAKPGPLKLLPNQVLTASQAIVLAGGFTPVAKQNDVNFIRGKEIKSLNLKKLYDKVENMERDIELQPGDILFIQESIW